MTRTQQRLGLFRLGTFRENLQSLVDQFGRFFHVAGALDKACYCNVFGDSLGFVIETFMCKRETRMGKGMFRFERCDTHPVLDGFINIALVEEEVCGFESGVDGFFEVTRALEQLREFFHGRWILRCDLRHPFIDL